MKSLFPAKRVVLFTLVSLVLIIGLTALIIMLNSPGKSTPITTTKPPDQAAEDASPRSLSAKYFSLTYPAVFDTVSNISQGDKTADEVYRVSSGGLGNRRTLVVTIKPLPPDGFAGESSYRLRLSRTSEYKVRDSASAPEGFTVIDKPGGTESAAFTAQGGKLAMLVYTSPEGKAVEEFDPVLGSFTWVN